MNHHICIEWDHGGEYAGEDDETRAREAAKGVFAMMAVDALAAQAAWEAHLASGAPHPPATFAAAVFAFARAAADKAATETWDDPDSGSVSIRVVELPDGIADPARSGSQDGEDALFPRLRWERSAGHRYGMYDQPGAAVPYEAIMVRRGAQRYFPLIEAAPTLYELLRGISGILGMAGDDRTRMAWLRAMAPGIKAVLADIENRAKVVPWPE